MILGPGFPLTPADSARAAAQVYTWSLLATAPLALACLASFALARRGAAIRLLAWRGAMAAVAMMAVAQLLPFRWTADVVPPGLAQPLVMLGRLQLVSATVPDDGAWTIRAVLGLYLIGVIVVLRPIVMGWRAARRLVCDAETARDDVGALFARCQRAAGIVRPVRLVVTDACIIPMTTGVLRPVVVVPRVALLWPRAELRALLLHELAHVRARDVAFRLAARVLCAICWFHPLAWVGLSQLETLGEEACDDRVLAWGVRASDYASLLVTATETLLPAPGRGASLALARRGVRGRLRAVVAPRAARRDPSRLHIAAAAALTLAVAIPLGALRPAPTREVLTSLMHDTRWDARAYAVVRLAQRPDTLAIARAAARHDPSARVRALASSEVARQAGAAALARNE